MATSPTVARWELSRRLGARRREQGVDAKTIADHLGFTRNYWSAVENDKTLIAEDKLRLLFDVLDFTKGDQEELLVLREASRRRGWWETYDDVLDEEGILLVGLELGASRIRSFEALIVPGLLQTEAFMRELTRDVLYHSPGLIDRVAEVRQRRQEQLLFGDDPIPYTAIISEAVINQRWVSPETQDEQHQHMLGLAEDHPTIEIRVLPFSGPPGGIAVSSTLMLLDYDSKHLPSVAWQEAIRPIGLIEEPDPHFQQIEFSWTQAMERCLSRDESLDALRQVPKTKV